MWMGDGHGSRARSRVVVRRRAPRDGREMKAMKIAPPRSRAIVARTRAPSRARGDDRRDIKPRISAGDRPARMIIII
jgi:hypothetical protein